MERTSTAEAQETEVLATKKKLVSYHMRFCAQDTRLLVAR